ncbi:hypothetical protein ILUMI_23790 [Ignelater luminosus]|uniref:Uncharacterized protein n=1 Tax=Ignelater luminosus TaxID=2038154 RepID=A0A8K0CEP0_IGNLU|nr:hypothetical protein ILUMI_23790 [Ignelater luminosus]
MQHLVIFACALAFASAGYPYYAQHIPLIDHNGVPVDTPEVQAAKALHLNAHAAAAHGVHYVAPYTGHYGIPNVGPDGTPIDTPEVQLAKAAHFIAYNEAAIRNANHYTAPYAAAAVGPIDTPEVQLAKAAHFAAHLEAKSRSGHHYRRRRGIAYNSYPQQIPVIGPNGVPQDTPEVQAAKAAHYAALAQSNSHQSSAPQQQQYNEHNPYYGPYHFPVIGPQGVPTETPEVQAAKAGHLAAFSQAGGLYHGGQSAGYYNPAPAYHGNAGPVDTPEVQAAKQAHLAAHAAAQGHRYY